MSSAWGLWGLFVSAFVSSTLFPGGSEVVLLLLAQHEDKWLLMAVATTGNTLGGMTSWLIGWIVGRRFPAGQLKKDLPRRAVASLQRWGSPILLLSWLPVVGDPLCIAAGWLRITWWVALLYIATGKAARYAVLLALA